MKMAATLYFFPGLFFTFLNWVFGLGVSVDGVLSLWCEGFFVFLLDDILS